MSLTKLELIALEDVPMVESGDDVTAIVRAGLVRADLTLGSQDVVIVAQKIISKAEGRRVDLAGRDGERARPRTGRRNGQGPACRRTHSLRGAPGLCGPDPG